MQLKRKVPQLLAIYSLALMSFQTNPIEDYLSVGSVLKFDNENYNLSWSSHPNATYYKQEYLRKKDNKSESYEKMIMVESVKGNITVEQASSLKINELVNLKKSNPLVSAKIENSPKGDEKTISFTISGGKNILEWNIYRYKQQKTDKENYLVLYGYSYRNYFTSKEDIEKFLKYVIANDKKMIGVINAINFPKVQTK